MKILHISVQSPYNEGWGYQENLLPKYQAKLGHDVTLVTSTEKNKTNNKKEKCPEEEYISPDGFRVIRLDYVMFKPKRVANFLRYYKIYDLLIRMAPDFIMVHGVSGISALQVKRYVKKINPQCIVVADNHIDERNLGSGLASRKIVGKICSLLWHGLNARMQKVYKKVYGVTPWRSEFAHHFFGIKEDLLDVLPAGADDEKIDYENKSEIRKSIRKKHDISENDFLIVTGGKIDALKKIDCLMEAFTKLEAPNVKLLVFGKCNDDVIEKVEELAKHKNIRYIGWITSDDTYNYFLAADLAFFPGRHSVMWEQACACGIPLVIADYYKKYHVDFGGNCFIIERDDVDCILCFLKKIFKNPEMYKKALAVASSEKKKQFLYSELAQKALEVTSLES